MASSRPSPLSFLCSAPKSGKSAHPSVSRPKLVYYTSNYFYVTKLYTNAWFSTTKAASLFVVVQASNLRRGSTTNESKRLVRHHFELAPRASASHLGPRSSADCCSEHFGSRGLVLRQLGVTIRGHKLRQLQLRPTREEGRGQLPRASSSDLRRRSPSARPT